MERVVRGRSFTLTKTFYSNGVAADPDVAPTVTITRDNGAAVTAGAVVNEAEVGVFSVTVPASENTLLDTLTVDWAATVNGESQEHLDTVEVAGGVLFTIAEARALKPLDSTTTYPTAKITEKRTLVEGLLEHECGVAFVPRYRKTTIAGTGGSTIMLPPRVTAIRSVTLDGVSIGATALATLELLDSGEVYYPSYWTHGGRFVIAYEHGYSDGVERMAAGDAALTWAKTLLVKGPVDDRMTSMSTEDGTYSLATPGIRGSVSGIPAVDSFIQGYNLNVAVA